MKGDHSGHQDDHGALPSATGGIARLAYARAQAAGLAVAPLLKIAGVSAAQMDDDKIRLRVRDQISFLNAAADALGDEFLGFHLAMDIDLREIGLLYYVAASSSTLIEALQRGARYCSIVNQGISQKCLDGKRLGVMFRYVGVSRHLDRHQIEFWMTATIRLYQHLTQRRLLPSRVCLTHFRDRWEPRVAELFGDNIEFGAATDLILFADEVRDHPIVSADQFLNKLLTSYCEEALSYRRANQATFRSKIENEIVPLLPHRKVAAADIAQRLALSRRTLSRRLAQENLTFAELMDELRLDLAKRYLADRSLSISQIAWLLGYREIGSFSHAFKRWTGRSPRAARLSRS